MPVKHKYIRQPEHARINDDLLVGKTRVKPHHEAPIVGEVEVIVDSAVDGKHIFTKSIKNNELLVNGAVFISEKINNIRSGFANLPLDVEVGTHTIDQINRTVTTIPDEKICGLVIGNGGNQGVYSAIYPVDRGARVVPGMIPYRVVPLGDDLNEADRKYYFMRVVRGDYAYYYGKTFDVDREIHVQYEDGTLVQPNDESGANSDKFIKTFTRYKITVDNRDVREYFKITEGSTLMSFINSVGLVAGYPVTDEDGNTEYCNVRCLTTLNMENQELKDTESTITFIYRLFIL